MRVFFKQVDPKGTKMRWICQLPLPRWQWLEKWLERHT